MPSPSKNSTFSGSVGSQFNPGCSRTKSSDRIRRIRTEFRAFPPMPDILDTERPVDRHVRNPAQSSAAGKHHRIPFDRRPPRHQCPDNPQSLFSIRVEVVTELRPDKNPAMETDKRDPFRPSARPAKRFQLLSLARASARSWLAPMVPFPLAFDSARSVLAVKGPLRPAPQRLFNGPSDVHPAW